MKKLNEALWANYEKVNSQIEGLTTEDDNYKLLLEERDKLRNELIKYEQTTIEADLKKHQIETEAKIKTGQIEAENKRDKIRNQISIATFAVTTGVSVIALYKTFKFDEVATVTSTLGRNILSNVVPKMFKR